MDGFVMSELTGDFRLKIEKQIEDHHFESTHREYLGFSILGHECWRKLWYDFRCVKKTFHSARQKRLFSRGHREEPIIITDLAKAGVVVHSDQKEVVICQGHCKGHCDGIAENVPDAPKTPHLLELKTCNDKHFKQLKKKNLKKTFPVYYAQMVGYMSELFLTRGLFIVVNKNTDERYYERIKENPSLARDLRQKAWAIISSEIPLPRINASPSYFQCNWCDYKDICHHEHYVEENCRTCSGGDICDNGKWECSFFGTEIFFEKQMKGCPSYNPFDCFKQ